MQADHGSDRVVQEQGVDADAGGVRPRPGDTVYRAFRNDRIDSHGVYVGTYYGVVSPCGEWVDCGEQRHRLTAAWHLRMVDAEAGEAGRIVEMARRLMDQAAELRRRAEA